MAYLFEQEEARLRALMAADDRAGAEELFMQLLDDAPSADGSRARARWLKLSSHYLMWADAFDAEEA